jgi:xanthine dehydrogenase small subunit
MSEGSSTTMTNQVTFILDGKKVQLNFSASSGLTPTTTVLNYLRSLPDHRGVKEGCAEGDCGACTVVVGEPTKNRTIRYRAVDSCLLFLPMLHGKQLLTVENLKNANGDLHPVQQSMVDNHGSQCGFCTPGIVMSLFALSKKTENPGPDEARVALAGNLCRCTGYRPIIDAAIQAGRPKAKDHFSIGESKTVKLLESISRKSISIATTGQRYDQPATLRECLDLLKKCPKATIINGATDVALRVTKKFETIQHIIDLSRVQNLAKTARSKSAITIGAGVKINDVMSLVQHDFPAFYEMLGVFGAEQIRNVATLGGNIATASPIGDILPVLIAYNAKIVLESNRGGRSVGAEKFVTGYRKTECRPDEIIISVVLPIPSKHQKVRAYKVSKRRDLDISTLSAGFMIDLNTKGIVRSVVLAYGGMAENTKRAELTEKFLQGKPWTREVVEQAQEFIAKDFNPISDVRGSAEFRKITAKNLMMKFWNDTQ